jgi:ribosomal protein L16 Arg81 hydroxylase
VSAQQLAPEWRAWIAENLLRGAASGDLSALLTEQGLPDAEAMVRQIEQDPILSAARVLLHRSAGVEQAARLRRGFDFTAPFERTTLTSSTFFDTYWTGHKPVVIRNAARDWPALGWTLSGLRDRFSDAQIEVLQGRATHQDWWRDRASVTGHMPFSDLIDAMQTTSGDDVYAVGRNALLDHPALSALREDLRTLPGIRPEDPHPRLWMGPAGTRTPLHHDQSSAWLVQLHGTKRVWLASPLEPALFSTAEGVFNTHDPSHSATGDLREVHWWTADLAPGDAVFLPVGWWHQLLALTPSISVSLGGFEWDHVRRWYAPGRAGNA